MQITIEWRGRKYGADLNKSRHISIPLRDGVDHQPNAYGAPLFETVPYKSGNFTGSLESGSPVNYYNVRLNPHGNGTHTESIGHIAAGKLPIHECLKDTHVIAELISVYPTKMDTGDTVIHAETLSALKEHKADALIVRTLPNETKKKFRKYTGNNPPYFSLDAMNWIHAQGYNWPRNIPCPWL